MNRASPCADTLMSVTSYSPITTLGSGLCSADESKAKCVVQGTRPEISAQMACTFQ